jgi:hypothetical protein
MGTGTRTTYVTRVQDSRESGRAILPLARHGGPYLIARFHIDTHIIKGTESQDSAPQGRLAVP